MIGMFENCPLLFEVDLSQFDFKYVTSYVDMFKNSSVLAIKTPKNVERDINLPLGLIPGTSKFYDLDFNEYTTLPKNISSSMLLVGEPVKQNIVKFCDNFNDGFGAICESNGNSDISKITNLWNSTAKDVKDHFSNGSMPWVMEFLKHDNSTHICSELQEFSERYDYIYSKYYSVLEAFGGNFAGRDISPIKSTSGTNIFYKLNNNNTTAVIVIYVISCVVIVSLAAFYVIHKRKEQ